MTCTDCVGHRAWADQLQRAYSEILEQEKKLIDTIKDRERTIETLNRELREAKDELRIRRSVTGYLPHLDQPHET